MSLFDKIAANDATVHRGLSAGASLEEIIIALSLEKEALQKKVLELEAIAPRKLKASDGKVFVWHCPDDLIPESKL